MTICFGWAVATTTLYSVFLQTPVNAGGYGFTPFQNAYFSFALWVGILAAEIYGFAFNDRIPLWMCRRRGAGLWKPECRLYPLLVPSLVLMPVSLGIVGAALQYHLHYMVLALALFLQQFSELGLVSVIFNYVVEAFVGHAQEVSGMNIPSLSTGEKLTGHAAILNFYRLILGLTVTFFVSLHLRRFQLSLTDRQINPWEARVGAGWTFGMMVCTQNARRSPEAVAYD